MAWFVEMDSRNRNEEDETYLSPEIEIIPEEQERFEIIGTAFAQKLIDDYRATGKNPYEYVPGNGPVRAGGSAAPELDPTVTNAPWLGLTDAPFGSVELPMNVELQIGEIAPLKQLVPIADAIDPAVAAAIAAEDEPTAPAVQPKRVVPIADTIDPEIAAAIAALRSNSGVNPLSAFNIPADSASFDAVSRGTMIPGGTLSNLPAIGSIDENWPTGGGPMLAPPPPALADSLAGISSITPTTDEAATDSAKRLALLRQDMSAFGGRSGLGQADWNGAEDRMLVSIF